MIRVLVAVALALVLAGCPRVPPVTVPPPLPKASIPDRIAQYGAAARARLAPHFAAAGVPYPPAHFLLLGLKQERVLELYAAGPGAPLTFIRAYPILGASGGPGPKLREGDRQVPEGVYRIVYLNPNSISHLSLALSYPNAFDRVHGESDGRPRATLGGDIMIHGGSGSIGCLAVGDEAAEDLFILAADSDWERAVVVVVPTDFRRSAPPPIPPDAPDWLPRLYAWLRTELEQLPPRPDDPTRARGES